jgi:hypothetical protein
MTVLPPQQQEEQIYRSRKTCISLLSCRLVKDYNLGVWFGTWVQLAFTHQSLFFVLIILWTQDFGKKFCMSVYFM